MKILFIKQLFNPEPTAKSLDFALELHKRGHQVQVLTGFPSYPLGEIYDGYKQKIWQRESMQGIDIIRLPIYPNQSDSGAKRMLHYLSYALSAAILGPFLVKKPDVAFVYQGAIPVGVPAIVFKYLRGVPFVYDINDLWPETVEVSGMMTNKTLLRIIENWCQINYRHADMISVATPGFKRKLIEKGVDEQKINFVPNWSRDFYKTDTLAQKDKDKWFPNDHFNILYAGNLGVVQSLDVVLKAAKWYQDNDQNKIRFILLGGGADGARLKRIKDEQQLENVVFLPRVDGSEVVTYLNSADALLVHLKKSALFEITIPSKILSYIRTGKPVLLGMKGDAADIIEDAQAGLLFEPDNANDLIEKINILLDKSQSERDQMGQNGQAYYDDHLSIEASTDKLEYIFKTICQA